MKLSYLPNCTGFLTYSKTKNFFADLFGVKKTDREFEILKDGRITVANNYLRKQYMRLIKAAKAGDKEQFTSIANMLMTKSKIYRMVGMNRTLSGWFFELKLSKIKSVTRKLKKLIFKYPKGQVVFDRTWIPKKEDKYGRPLGVPTMEWRIWSWMNLNLMEIWYNHTGQLPTWQHGGRSGKGVVTAWSEVLEVLDRKYLYEFDLKGFFNNVNHKAVIKFIENTGYGQDLTTWVEETLASRVRRRNLPPMEEERPEFHVKAMNVSKAIYAIKLMESEAFDLLKSRFDLYRVGQMGMSELKDTFEKDLLKTFAKPETAEIIGSIERKNPTNWGNPEKDITAKLLAQQEERNRTEWKERAVLRLQANKFVEAANKSTMAGLYTSDDLGDVREQHFGLLSTSKGLPQGLGTSPFLSVQTLAYYWNKSIGVSPRWKDNKGLVMYMDDGLIYADTQEELDSKVTQLNWALEQLGVEIEPKKSRIVKEHGIWKEDLKFLGMTYQYAIDWMKSDTRNGVSIQFPRAQMRDHISDLYAKGNSSNINWLVKGVFTEASYKAAYRFGLLGLFIAQAQAPQNIDKSMQQLIQIGINKVDWKLTKLRGTFWHHNRDQWISPMEPVDRVMTASSKAIRHLLDNKF
jgi:hypothetical protein